MTFRDKQIGRVLELMRDNSGIFNGDTGGGVFRGHNYDFVLEEPASNLYGGIADAAMEYFSRNNIAWWGGKEPVGHPLSSQITCVNHLFPLRQDAAAVLAVARGVCPDIVQMLPLLSDKFSPAYVQFEAVSDTDHLNEKTSTRGSNCTSIDALMLGETADGRRVLLVIEWKYIEAYGNENKAAEDAGEVRKQRYTELINQSGQLVADCHEIYYYEPFYQLMRQTLWAEQMVRHSDSERVKADSYIHVHVIPADNAKLLEKQYTCSGLKMEATWRGCLKEQNKYVIVTPEDFLKGIDGEEYAGLIGYLRVRYWA